MAAPRLRRRALSVIGLGVALPASLLAGLGIYLTLRIASAIEDENVRYNSYMAQQVAEAFEQELLAHLRGAIGSAENEARNDAGPAAITAALEAGTREFRGAQFVPLDAL